MMILTQFDCKMKNLFFIFFFCFSLVSGQNDLDLSYYFKNLDNFNKDIPKPSSITLGNKEVGFSHVSHDRLVQYMENLAQKSERVNLSHTGQTFEGRPLVLLTITSEENHKKLEKIKSEHLKLNFSENNDHNFDEMPVVIYQGYSIHGNEPSGSNAALLYAYYLAANEEKKFEEILDNVVILLDPAMNPDGLQRFANWVNINKSEKLNPDSNDREFNENWPRGRTNHYWFDMNRDWLPIQLPESKARIKSFHEWSPNVLTDHHEMGTNSTFFFQPGIKSRVNPLTPAENQKLTSLIGKYHDKRLSEVGSLFYSEEDYDDFYFGKGSTFPDINGSVGILFEQGSSRGHLQNSINGLISFPFTIKNQLITSLSTLEASYEMKNELLKYQTNFFKDSKNKADKLKGEYYLINGKKDQSKLYHFQEILHLHGIITNELDKKVTINNIEFETENSLLIPKNQNKIRLIEAMFENRTSFKDSLFYDVSAWSFLHSFNLNYVNYKSKSNYKKAELKKPKGQIINSSDYAYVFPWHDYYAPKVLYKLLDSGIRVKVGTEPFKIETKSFDYGSLLIHLKNQEINEKEIEKIIKALANESGVNFFGYDSSTTNGIDLGSNKFRNVEKPNIALLVGDGVNSYDAGEIWHLMDTRYKIPVTKINVSRLNSYDLSKYNTIIMVNGNYSSSENSIATLKKWISDGGNLIGYRNTINWLNKNKVIKVNFNTNSPSTKNLKFQDIRNHFGSQLTSGAIFNVKLDLSHPINYGYTDSNLSIFRNTNIYIKNDSIGYNNPIRYVKSPLVSGYISKENAKSIENSRPFVTTRSGKGRVSVFTDNTNFRAFWYGTNKLLMNAIFFDNLMY